MTGAAGMQTDLQPQAAGSDPTGRTGRYDGCSGYADQFNELPFAKAQRSLVSGDLCVFAFFGASKKRT